MSIKCEKCDYAVDTKYRMKQHVYNRHTPYENLLHFKCKQCDFESKRKGNLVKHMVHMHNCTQIKCTHCDFETSNKYKLKEHQKMHYVDYQCKKCKMYFLTKKECIEHITTCVVTSSFL